MAIDTDVDPSIQPVAPTTESNVAAETDPLSVPKVGSTNGCGAEPVNLASVSDSSLESVAYLDTSSVLESYRPVPEPVDQESVALDPGYPNPDPGMGQMEPVFNHDESDLDLHPNWSENLSPLCPQAVGSWKDPLRMYQHMIP